MDLDRARKEPIVRGRAILRDVDGRPHVGRRARLVYPYFRYTADHTHPSLTLSSIVAGAADRIAQ
jgi:hypothetical protein